MFVKTCLLTHYGDDKRKARENVARVLNDIASDVMHRVYARNGDDARCVPEPISLVVFEIDGLADWFRYC